MFRYGTITIESRSLLKKESFGYSLPSRPKNVGRTNLMPARKLYYLRLIAGIVILDVNFCRDHRDKTEVPDPLAVEDLISYKLNNRRKLARLISDYTV